ncbi:unnamed protein product [Parascedosporium putredinis]|uniref:Uncharacterized protein n=1 Tax=Parascedosporium putredinis TaxID=1442378 RepID=A0A9P1GWH5_9PEZI|nr:unnamed protein product [Parascedosporium putredinis]CAI7988857.1 unnamed protein product [Parascedosporium putredinis]
MTYVIDARGPPSTGTVRPARGRPLWGRRQQGPGEGRTAHDPVARGVGMTALPLAQADLPDRPLSRLVFLPKLLQDVLLLAAHLASPVLNRNPANTPLTIHSTPRPPLPNENPQARRYRIWLSVRKIAPAALRPFDSNRVVLQGRLPGPWLRRPLPRSLLQLVHPLGPTRSDAASPPVAPTGPRGYVAPSRGSYNGRGPRSSWASPLPPRHATPTAQSPAPTTPSASGIPTGPRYSVSSATQASPANPSKPFHPPTAPASQLSGPSTRPTIAQSLWSSMPPVVSGGKVDPSLVALTSGVTREVEPHYRKLREEEERLREELRVKQDKLSKNLRQWDKLERDAKAWELRSDLSENSMRNLAGDGPGAAF